VTQESGTPQVPDLTDRALESFVEQPVPPMSAAEARELRGRVLARIAEVQREGRTARRARRWAALSMAGAAAATALVGTAVWSRGRASPRAAEVEALEGQSEIAHAGTERPLVDPGRTTLGPSDELRTGPQSRAGAVLATGASVDVGPGSRLRFVGPTDPAHLRDRVDLLAGKIDVQVPKLRDGDEVRIVTDDATVVVHGTRFSVERTPAGTGHVARTRVAVVEGRVAVLTLQGERMLSAGADWASAPVDELPPEPAPPPSAGPGRNPTPSSDGASSLKSENSALADAMRLIRENLDAQALARLDDLLARYPSSPLAENARVERLRVLQRLGSPRLRHEAERYLADYPNGSARDDAMRWARPKSSP
jgi:hypothetical protein